MIDHFMNHIVESAVAIIVGIFVIDMLCIGFLGFSPIDMFKELIAKITGKKDED